MRSARERTAWTILVVVLAAGAAVAWWKADQWLPQARPWAEKTWGQLMRPGEDSLPPEKKNAQGAAAGVRGAASAPPPQLRKCIQEGRTVYTDQPCAPGGQEHKVNGEVTSFPRSP